MCEKVNQTSNKNTKDMYVRNIQFKIWHNRIATNRFLYQIGIVDSPNCIYCNEEENNKPCSSKGFGTKLKLLARELEYDIFIYKIRQNNGP